MSMSAEPEKALSERLAAFIAHLREREPMTAAGHATVITMEVIAAKLEALLAPHNRGHSA